MAFAEGTTVPVEKTRAEIEGLLRKHGATRFASGWDEKQASIMFEAHRRALRFTLAMPDPKDRKFVMKPNSSWARRSTAEAQKAVEAETRRRWRCLLLVIKAKLEAVQSGVSSFEQEFMPWIVMPDGKTVAEHVVPAIEAAYATGQMPRLLPPSGEP